MKRVRFKNGAAWRFANYILNYRIKENKPITNLQYKISNSVKNRLS